MATSWTSASRRCSSTSPARSSLAELQQRLRAYAAAHPKRRWIIGCGWNQELWPDKTFPDRRRPRRDRPRPAGRARTRRRPCARRQQRGDEGCRDHRRDPGASRAAEIENGLFVDNATDLIDEAVPAPTQPQMDVALAKAQDILLGFGVTGVGSMSTSLDDWNALRRAGDAGTLKVRLMVYAARPRAAAAQSPHPTPWLYGDRLRAGRRQVLRRRRARLARRLAEAALCRQAGHARPAVPFGRRASRRWPTRPRRTASRSRPTRSAMPPMRRSSAPTSGCDRKYGTQPPLADRACPDRRSAPTCRGSRRAGSSPRCSRPTRPATG